MLQQPPQRCHPKHHPTHIKNNHQRIRNHSTPRLSIQREHLGEIVFDKGEVGEVDKAVGPGALEGPVAQGSDDDAYEDGAWDVEKVEGRDNC